MCDRKIRAGKFGQGKRVEKRGGDFACVCIELMGISCKRLRGNEVQKTQLVDAKSRGGSGFARGKIESLASITRPEKSS